MAQARTGAPGVAVRGCAGGVAATRVGGAAGVSGGSVGSTGVVRRSSCGRVRRHGARGQGALPQADHVHVAREGEVAAADVAADRRGRAGGRPVDPGGSVRRVADRAAVDVEPQAAAVERAGDVVPAAVPDVGRARGRRDDVARAVEGVEGDAAALGGVEAVGAGEAALAAAGDDVAVRAGARGRAHHGLDGERRLRELGRVGELDVGAAAEAQRAARDAGDPLRVRGVDAGGGAEAAVEPERPAVERGLAAGLVEAPFADGARVRVRGLGAEREGERDRTGGAGDPPSPSSPARHQTRRAPDSALHLGSLPYTVVGETSTRATARLRADLHSQRSSRSFRRLIASLRSCTRSSTR